MQLATELVSIHFVKGSYAPACRQTMAFRYE